MIKTFLTYRVAQVLAALLLFQSAAFASTEGSGHIPPFEEYLRDLLPFWINFLSYCVILFFLLKKPLRVHLYQRTVDFRETMQKAQSELNESQKLLRDAETRLAEIQVHKQQIRQEIEKEADDEAQRILGNAKVRSEAIMQAAHEMGQAEQLAAERAVQGEIIETALGMARERLAKEIGAPEDQAYRQTAVDSVDGLIQ